MLVNEKLSQPEDFISLTSSKMNEREVQSSLRFKCFIIVQMIFFWTSYTVMVRYSRSSTPKHLVCHFT